MGHEKLTELPKTLRFSASGILIVRRLEFLRLQGDLCFSYWLCFFFPGGTVDLEFQFRNSRWKIPTKFSIIGFHTKIPICLFVCWLIVFHNFPIWKKGGWWESAAFCRCQVSDSVLEALRLVRHYNVEQLRSLSVIDSTGNLKSRRIRLVYGMYAYLCLNINVKCVNWGKLDADV